MTLPTSSELISAGLVTRLVVGWLQIERPDGLPLEVEDLERLQAALERALRKGQQR
jgi:hypothetical protein